MVGTRVDLVHLICVRVRKIDESVVISTVAIAVVLLVLVSEDGKEDILIDWACYNQRVHIVIVVVLREDFLSIYFGVITEKSEVGTMQIAYIHADWAVLKVVQVVIKRDVEFTIIVQGVTCLGQ